jgi:DNA repair exonuclease SbcCD ATPase subunit
MKNLKFKSAFAQNFLPFGPEGIKIDFDSIGNIVLIKGENIDYKDASSRESSNGSGKSSIQEIIVWTLFGKTVKNPKKLNKNDVIHNIHKKNCKTEVCFDSYKVQRGRAPDYLKLWKQEGDDWVEITQGKSQDTQQRIDEEIGLSYEAFLSTSIFTDDQSNCFLEADAAKKREIVEDLLLLSVYKQRFENSKVLLKENKNLLRQFTSEYELLLTNRNSVEVKIQNSKNSDVSWKNNKKKEMSDALISVKNKKQKLDQINEDKDMQEYKTARENSEKINKEIESNNVELKQVVEKKNDIKKSIDDQNKEIISKKEKIRNFEFDKKTKLSEVEKNNKEIKLLEKNESGQVCKNCYSKIDPENYKSVIEKYKDKNNDLNSDINKIENSILSLDVKLDENSLKENEKIYQNFYKQEISLNKKLQDYREEFLKYSSVKEPESNSSKKVLEAEIEMLSNKVKEMKNEYENSPYKEIIDGFEKDLVEADSVLSKKKESISEIESQLPYYEFWTNAFGDNGIRKWIVDGIIPALNSRLEYWMQVLDDNRIKIEFNNQLEETIHKTLDENIEFYYYTMSAGQKRRLNLAVNQSFAHIMMLTTNTCPSICFLDEVTTNIDPVGVQGIYNMICELSEHRQIFITTHDTDLLNMLSGCDTLNLKMENAVSKLEV